MELHQLRYFLAVVDEGTFTSAARVVRISQSGVSTQIRKLERELGVALIDRLSRRVALTTAGERLLPTVRTAVAAIDEVTGVANEIRGLMVGSLRVGTVTGLVWPELFDALANMHAEHPGIDIRLDEGNSADLLARVGDGDLDVAVAAWADQPPTDLRSRLVVDDPLVAVVARGHRWAHRATISATELAEADLITLNPGTGARAALDALLTRVGAHREPRWQVATPAFVQMLTTRGLGIGIVSSTTAHGWSDVVPLAIDDDRARSRLGVVWRDEPVHTARALLARLLNEQS